MASRSSKTQTDCASTRAEIECLLADGNADQIYSLFDELFARAESEAARAESEAARAESEAARAESEAARAAEFVEQADELGERVRGLDLRVKQLTRLTVAGHFFMASILVVSVVAGGRGGRGVGVVEVRPPFQVVFGES